MELLPVEGFGLIWGVGRLSDFFVLWSSFVSTALVAGPSEIAVVDMVGLVAKNNKTIKICTPAEQQRRHNVHTALGDQTIIPC